MLFSSSFFLKKKKKGRAKHDNKNKIYFELVADFVVVKQSRFGSFVQALEITES